jgi:hypothetical protein
LFEFGWEKEDCKETRLIMKKKTDSPQSNADDRRGNGEALAKVRAA